MLPDRVTKEYRELIDYELQQLGYKRPITRAQYAEAADKLRERHEAQMTVEVQDRYITRLESALQIKLTKNQKERIRSVVGRHGFLRDINELQ